MKSEDTVMSKVNICQVINLDHKWLAVSPGIVDKEEKVAQTQADISFKAGMKKVVELIKNDAYFCEDIMDGDTLPSEPDRYLVQFSRDAWRAIIKGMGV